MKTDTRECTSCGGPTEHREFEIDGRQVFICWVCLRHWKPEQKRAHLYTCLCCEKRWVSRQVNGTFIVSEPPRCFVPDRSEVELHHIFCAPCLVETGVTEAS